MLMHLNPICFRLCECDTSHSNVAWWMQVGMVVVFVRATLLLPLRCLLFSEKVSWYPFASSEALHRAQFGRWVCET